MSSIRELEKRVGEEVGISPWVEVTQERIDTFAKAIDDHQNRKIIQKPRSIKLKI